ncbi:MAG: aminopeptidase P family protein [Sedimentisphaerales bacterium]|nr:aminopeptidase P family protein [Sedimentisphaerales bacterium]
MRKEILKQRIKQVKASLADARCQALLITSKADVTYLSGFTGDDSWLIAAGRSTYLVTDSRYIIQAQRDCPLCRIYERKGRMADAVEDVLKKVAGVKTLAVEDTIRLSVFNALKKKLSVRLKTIKSPAGVCRGVKDEFEVAAIRRAGRIAQTALSQILPKVRVGMSEAEVGAMLEFEIKKYGATIAFDSIIAFGANAAMPHYLPGSRKLKKVDTVLIDFGARFGGYNSDITRCFAVGKVNKLYEKVYKTVFASQKAAIKAVGPGQSPDVIDAAAREVITTAKLPPFGHGTGHGIGLEVHERPIISSLSTTPLERGNIITIEPAIYLPGKFGVRIEDDVLVTETGKRILTSPLKNDEVPVLKIKN